MNTPSLIDMLKAGMHFGHQESRWHPKMQPYIFGSRNGVHIINLEMTQEKLSAALEYVKGLASRGGTIMFVGTKRQAQDVVKREAERVGMPFVNERWLGGTLTNFSVIHTTIKRFRDLQKQRASGELAAKYTKKEQIVIDREIEEMADRVGGIASMDKLPDAMFILDIKHEKTAYLEALARKIPVVALVDTNVNPEEVAWPIPANDDAVRSITMAIGLIADAVLEGKRNPVVPAVEVSRVAHVEAAAPVAEPVVAAVAPEAVPEAEKVAAE